MKRNKRNEKRRWAAWHRHFFGKTEEQIRADYDSVDRDKAAKTSLGAGA